MKTAVLILVVFCLLLSWGCEDWPENSAMDVDYFVILQRSEHATLCLEYKMDGGVVVLKEWWVTDIMASHSLTHHTGLKYISGSYLIETRHGNLPRE